jgi:hypothetical protein
MAYPNCVELLEHYTELGDIDCVRDTIEEYVDIFKRMACIDFVFDTALDIASTRGYIDIVRLLCQQIYQYTGRCAIPLLKMCLHGQLDAFKACYTEGDTFTDLYFNYACQSGNLDLVIHVHSLPLMPYMQRDYEHAISVSCRAQQPHIARYIINTYIGADVPIATDDICASGDLTAVMRRCAANLGTEHWFGGIQAACRYGHYDIVLYILTHTDIGTPSTLIHMLEQACLGPSILLITFLLDLFEPARVARTRALVNVCGHGTIAAITLVANKIGDISTWITDDVLRTVHSRYDIEILDYITAYIPDKQRAVPNRNLYSHIPHAMLMRILSWGVHAPILRWYDVHACLNCGLPLDQLKNVDAYERPALEAELLRLQTRRAELRDALSDCNIVADVLIPTILMYIPYS